MEVHTMTENTTAKFINLTEVFPVYAKATIWSAFAASPPKIIGATTAEITVNAGEIVKIEDVPPGADMATHAATYIHGRALSLYAKQQRAEILKRIADAPALT
jgi:hypothetical protein